MSREILVVKRDKLFLEGAFQGFVPLSEKDFTNLILENYEYRERDDMEGNPSFQQPIPYVWLVNTKTKKVFMYKRAADRNKEEGYKEIRHRNKWSGGVGGHIDKDTEETHENPILAAMGRELQEEVQMGAYPEPKIVGFLNDDSDLLGQDHFGIIAIADTEENVETGDDEMQHGQFYSIEEIEEIMRDPDNKIENWTAMSWPFVKSHLSNI